MARFDESLTVIGSISCTSITSDGLNFSAIPRDNLIQETFVPFPVNLTDFRIWDAMQTNLPGTSSGDDLALIGGTFGTASPTIRTADLKAAGATNVRARVIIPLPAEYDAAETCQIRVRGGMVTTIADVSCTVDVEAYRVNEDGGIGSDLCATSATTINSLTKANVDFNLTAATLSAGDRLDVRITVACNDAATVTAVIAELSRVALLCDIKG